MTQNYKNGYLKALEDIKIYLNLIQELYQHKIKPELIQTLYESSIINHIRQLEFAIEDDYKAT